MVRNILLAVVSAAILSSCASASRDYHGYIIDDARPAEIKPGEDTRSSVLATLGSPSTSSLFDDERTWMYMSSTRERFAFYLPKVTQRNVVAIRFGEDDIVDEVLEYNQEDGSIIQYAARETPTRGRELGILEQIFGNVGRVALPEDSRGPDDIGRT